MIYIGIDNGLSGGAVRTTFGPPNGQEPLKPVSKYAFKSVKRPDGNHLDSQGLKEWILGELRLISDLSGIRPDMRAVVEEPAKGQGAMTTATAIASTHTSFGRTLAVLEELDIPYLTVPASTWMTRLWGVNGEWARYGKVDKPSVEIATTLWPGFDWRKSNLGKKPADGITDAYMLTIFGRRYWSTEPAERAERDRKTAEAKKRKRERKKAAKMVEP